MTAGEGCGEVYFFMDFFLREKKKVMMYHHISMLSQTTSDLQKP